MYSYFCKKITNSVIKLNLIEIMNLMVISCVSHDSRKGVFLFFFQSKSIVRFPDFSRKSYVVGLHEMQLSEAFFLILLSV